MADLSVPAGIAAAGGITILGVATGLDPAILIAGFAGGVWAQSYNDPAPYLHRVALTALAAILAGYLAPAASAGLMSVEAVKQAFPGGILQLPLAVLVGLTVHKVLGPAFMRFAQKKADEVTK